MNDPKEAFDDLQLPTYEGNIRTFLTNRGGPKKGLVVSRENFPNLVWH